jgi:CheY-like chemotaxis protein
MAIHKVLLIDDDADDCYVFSLLIKEVNPQLQIVTCHQCEDAIGCLQNTVPDLVFLDIHFPRMNGYDCIQMIRDHNAFKHLPIIMYSSVVRANEISCCYGLGANLFLIKPDDHNELKDSLKKILGLNWNDTRSITTAQFKNGNYLPFSLSIDAS